MITRQSLMVMIVAIVAGLAAAYALRVYLTPPEVPPAAKPTPPRMMTVPLASENLPANRVIMSGDIVNVKMTEKQFLARFKGINADQVMASGAQIARRRLKEPVKRGQPFLTTNFYLEGIHPGVAGKLQPGFRAIRVEVPDTRDGGVQNGVFVDVLFRAKPQKAEHGQPAIPEMTTTLLRHIEVLTTDYPQPRGGGPKGEPPVPPEKKSVIVTLAVPEEKTNIFGIVEGRGELWLVPTPPTAPATAPTTAPTTASEKHTGSVSEPTTLAGLLGIKPIKIIRPPPPFETAIYRGSHGPQINRFIDGKLVLSHTVEHRSVTQDVEGHPGGDLRSLPVDSPRER
jgi:Flp pilus assembly protein CpaB